jgi:hypothetical protein
VLEFQSELFLEGKTATGLAVPPEVVDELASGKRPAVKVTINGYTYRSTVAPMGGRFLLPVSAEVRERAGVTAGELLTVRVELDTEPRSVDVPDDLAAALALDPLARNKFDSLSYSNQRRHVLSVEGAKTAETRQRRVEKAVRELGTGP